MRKKPTTKPFLWVAILTFCGGVSGQTFEVASIRLNTSGPNGSHASMHGGEISLQNISLKELIEKAYDIQDFGVSGPEWMASQRFDVIAKPPSGVGSDQRGKMLQALLAERFKLTAHREAKTIQAYALVVGKEGHKLKEVEAGSSHTQDSKRQLTAQRTSMKWLADWLAIRLSSAVVDKTEIKGVFDFTLQWTPEENATDNAAGPSIFTALQEQLGLRLQAQKLPVEVVVVDHVEKVPTEN